MCITSLSLTCVAMLAVSGAPITQDPPTSQPERPTTPSSETGDDFLRGPDVRSAMQPTLVRPDAMGRFQPTQVRPEEAALAVIEIAPERRDLARAVIQERNIALGRYLVAEIDAVRDATDLIRDDKRDEAQTIYDTLHDGFDTTEQRTPLLAALTTVLSGDELGEVARVVDEYWTAWIDWETRNARVRTDDLIARTEERLVFQVFQREIGEAYNWSLRPIRNRLDTIYAVTEATEEQRREIRAIILDLVRDAGLESTPEQRRATTRRILTVLSEDQRLRLLDRAIWN